MKTATITSIAALTAGSVASVIPRMGGLKSNASASIWVSSYDGNLYQLDSSPSPDGSSYTFDISKNTQCGASPSWLTWDRDFGELYCLNENLAGGNGSISKYNVNDQSNSIQLEATKQMLPGPVSGVPFGEADQRSLAVAHYGGHGLSIWSTADGALTETQEFTFKLAHPGPVPDRQDAAYEHEAILDPTGGYVLVPDLGADLVRVFSVSESSRLTEEDPLESDPGTGPRHGVFWSPAPESRDAQWFFFLTQELTSTVTSYSVTYGNPGLTFEKIAQYSSVGDQEPAATTFVAEIAVAPDNKFVIVSNRGDTSVSMPDPTDSSKQIQSDSLVTFTPKDDGSLEFYRKDGAGGSWPRQFAINQAGTLVAVPLQYGESLSLLARDPVQGVIGPVVGYQSKLGNATCAQFFE